MTPGITDHAPRAITARGDLAVAAARSWVGTPYHHQMAVKGAGCDCLGLIRGVYAELYGREPEAPPPYSRDWAEATGTETLIEAARKHLLCVLPLGTSPSLLEDGDATPSLCPGDVLIFRMKRGAPAKHAGLLATHTTMIHAFENNPVCEVPFTPWWRRRLAAAFRFPFPEALTRGISPALPENGCAPPRIS